MQAVKKQTPQSAIELSSPPRQRTRRSLCAACFLTTLAIATYYAMLPASARAIGGHPSPRPAESIRPSSSSLTPLDQQWTVASQSALKISVRKDNTAVRKDGWYRVSQPELVAAGFNPNVDPRLLQLFADGVEVPMVVNSASQSQLQPGDYLEFYGQALDTLSTDTRIYYLVTGSSFGQRIQVSPAPVASPPGASSFLFTLDHKERNNYLSYILNGEESNFFGQVLADSGTTQPVGTNRSITAKGPVGEHLTVYHLDVNAGGASLEIAMQGATYHAHQVKVTLNNTDIGTFNFSDQEHKVATFPFATGLLQEGDNNFTLTATGGQGDASLVDYLRLTYPHLYTADGNVQRFTADGSQPVSIGGFTTPNIRLIDITNPSLPKELTVQSQVQGSGYGITFQVPGPHTFLAFANQQVEQAAGLTLDQPSSWHAFTPGADLVIISHRNFLQSLPPLQDLRQKQGLAVAVVDVEDVYDEFSFGAHTPQAVKDFLSYTRNWPQVPRYVLLVGDGSYDPRNFQGSGFFDFVPAKLIDTTFKETASDDWFVDFDNDGLPEMAIGRLSVRTAAEANTVISKITNFIPLTSLSVRGALLVSDRFDSYDFVSFTNSLRPLLPTAMGVQTVNRADGPTDADVRNRIVAGINQGPAIVNYYGHGSVDIWTGGKILSDSDASALTNLGQLSLFTVMNCLNGYFQDPVLECLGETLLKSPTGGAVAVWTSSGESVPFDQINMNEQAYRLLFSGLALGDVVVGAKKVIQDPDVRRTWILLGDPTMRLIIPFSDAAPGYAFYQEINKLWAHGVTVGCGGGNYCPEGNVTREQMAAFIIKAKGIFNPSTNVPQRFFDVPQFINNDPNQPNPFYGFIDQMGALGITSGCGGGNYCPKDPVTREQMAAFIIRAKNIFNPSTNVPQRFLDVPKFIDNDPNQPNAFYGFIDQMGALKITSGCGGGNYCPKGLVTRAQMAAFITRAFGW